LIAQWDRFLAGQATSEETSRWLRRQPSYDYPETSIVKTGLKLLREQVKSADRTGSLADGAEEEFRAWRGELAAYDSDPMGWYRSNDRLVERLRGVPKRHRLEVVRHWQRQRGDQLVNEILARLGISWDELIADAPRASAES
jgi:hypothetical protein